MSDEEELRRYSAFMASQGVGEELVDITAELKELGIER